MLTLSDVFLILQSVLATLAITGGILLQFNPKTRRIGVWISVLTILVTFAILAVGAAIMGSSGSF